MLKVISGICWTIVYVILIYRGFKDKSYGIPLVALSLNFSWEFVFAFIYKTNDSVSAIINPIWFILDLIIVITYFLYSYNYFKQEYDISKCFWLFISICSFLSSFTIMLIGTPFFIKFDFFRNSIFEVAIFIAYIQNAIMSILFVNTFYSRKKYNYSIDGQSFYSALLKFIGTSPTAGIYYILIHPNNWYFIGIFIFLCFIFDLLYCIFIWNELKAKGINPFKRL